MTEGWRNMFFSLQSAATAPSILMRADGTPFHYKRLRFCVQFQFPLFWWGSVICTWPALSYSIWNRPPCVLLTAVPSPHVCTWQGMSGWVAVVCSGVGGSWADGCDSHVLRDSRGSWWWWQATHNVLFPVWVCSLSVTSECSLATAFMTVFRGAANWKWNCGWALRQAQAALWGKCHVRTIRCLDAQFVIIFPGRASRRCVWRFHVCTQIGRAECPLLPREPLCTHWAGNQAICLQLTFVRFSLKVFHCVGFLF